MDFRLGETRETVRDLARGILEKEVTRERLRAAESSEDGIDLELWRTLADAGLLGVAVPEAQGGMGQGLLELCALLEEVGRAVAPVPLLPALVLGGLPVARFGSEAQREHWLRPLAAGEALLTAALDDAGSDDPARPATRARRDGPPREPSGSSPREPSGSSPREPSGSSGWILDGARRLVPAARISARVLVPADTGEGVGLFLVDPRAAGVRLTAQRTSTREVLFDLALDGVRVPEEDLLGGDAQGGAEGARWLRDCALAALCATQVGVSERALEITTGHVRERVQFGVPIGSFQSVQHRAADCWIDLQAMRWTAWRAAWKLSEGLDAALEAAVAKFWAAEGGSRIANAAQHLHGGLGVDVDYPLHRYFLWSKSLELAQGGATPQLARLGRALARSAPQEIA